MDKNNIIIFGASKRGQLAFESLKDQYNIKFFCDNDSKKHGTQFNGITVITPSELNSYKDCTVVIASAFVKEIQEQLNILGVVDYKIFMPASLSNTDVHSDLQSVNIGHFFQNCHMPMQLCDMTFLRGGSGILDYLFIAAIIEKFGVKTYLEIGTYFGESLSVASKRVEKCYSITLPPETYSGYTNHFIGKNNLGTCFPIKKDNITIFYDDSKLFDFTKIGEKMDLIFIDGDHSYEGILNDTQKCFEHLVDLDNTIVIWHDLKSFSSAYNFVVEQSLHAIMDGTPKIIHNNIYRVDNNICGVYIPDKYIHHFSTTPDDNAIYSYNIKFEAAIENRV